MHIRQGRRYGIRRETRSRCKRSNSRGRRAATTRGPIKALVVVTYLAMVTMNYLANALPLNGRGTGDVSDAYPSLFTPAGLTFSIWGVIYLLLGLHVLYQLGLFRGDEQDDVLLNRVGLLFSVSSLANTAWVFAWHYDVIWLSVVLIVTILVCLILITNILRVALFVVPAVAGYITYRLCKELADRSPTAGEPEAPPGAEVVTLPDSVTW